MGIIKIESRNLMYLNEPLADDVAEASAVQSSCCFAGLKSSCLYYLWRFPHYNDFLRCKYFECVKNWYIFFRNFSVRDPNLQNIRTLRTVGDPIFYIYVDAWGPIYFAIKPQNATNNKTTNANQDHSVPQTLPNLHICLKSFRNSYFQFWAKSVRDKLPQPRVD